MLRSVRKAFARLTGLHAFFSGKKKSKKPKPRESRKAAGRKPSRDHERREVPPPPSEEHKEISPGLRADAHLDFSTSDQSSRNVRDADAPCRSPQRPSHVVDDSSVGLRRSFRAATARLGLETEKAREGASGGVPEAAPQAAPKAVPEATPGGGAPEAAPEATRDPAHEAGPLGPEPEAPPHGQEAEGAPTGIEPRTTPPAAAPSIETEAAARSEIEPETAPAAAAGAPWTDASPPASTSVDEDTIEQVLQGVESYKLSSTESVSTRSEIQKLLSAVQDDDLDAVRRLLKTVDVNARDDDGYSALFVAAEEGLVDLTAWLVRHGAQLEAHDSEGRTPVYAAAVAGQADVVDYLVRQAGANADVANATGRHVFWAVAALELNEVARVLLDANAATGNKRIDINARDPCGLTALDFARAMHHDATAQFLKDRGALDFHTNNDVTRLARDWEIRQLDAIIRA